MTKKKQIGRMGWMIKACSVITSQNWQTMFFFFVLYLIFYERLAIFIDQLCSLVFRQPLFKYLSIDFLRLLIIPMYWF